MLQNLLDKARKLFPQIYERAFEIYSKGGIRRYRIKDAVNILDFWCVTGFRSVYIVMIRKNKFVCSCPDYVFHVMLKSDGIRRTFCAHSLACIIALIRRRQGIHNVYKLAGNQLEYFLREWI